MRGLLRIGLLVVFLVGLLPAFLVRAGIVHVPAQTASPASEPFPEVKLLIERGKEQRAKDWNGARARFQEALQRAIALRDPIGEIHALFLIGEACFNLKQLPAAADYTGRAYAAARKAQLTQQITPYGELAGMIYAMIGQGEIEKGRIPEAIASLLQSLDYLEQVNSPEQQTARLALTIAYLMAGSRDIAMQYLADANLTPEDAAKFQHLVDINLLLGGIYTARGIVLEDRKSMEQALEYFRKATAYYENRPEKQRLANALLGQGSILAYLDQPQAAAERIRQARELFPQIVQPMERAGLRLTAAIFDLAVKPYPQSVADMEKTLEQLRREDTGRNFDYLEAAVYAGIGECHARNGNDARAAASFQRSLDKMEASRRKLGGLTGVKMEFQALLINVYQANMDFQLRRGRPELAFALAQQSKARGLLDTMLNGRVDMNRFLVPAERQRLAAFQSRLDTLHRKLTIWSRSRRAQQKESGRAAQTGGQKSAGKPAGAKPRIPVSPQKIQSEIVREENAMQQYRDVLYSRHPEMVTLHAARTLRLADVARFLPEDTAALEYVRMRYGSGKEKVDQVALFVVTVEKGRPQLHAATLPGSGEEIGKAGNELLLACATWQDYTQAARAAYRLLIAPAADRIAGKKRLLICPDESLWNIPYAALTDEAGKPLIERFEIAHAYSLSGMSAALSARRIPRRARPEREIIAFVNPDFGDLRMQQPRTIAMLEARGRAMRSGKGLRPLPGTQKEAEKIQALFGRNARVYSGKKALVSTARREIGRYRYVHIATHGEADSQAPMQSWIALAQPPAREKDSPMFLTARDICGLSLSADLVVLSACRTARGALLRGEGVVGLTWALLAAGSPASIVSQWQVGDSSTAALMSAFYSQLKSQQGQAKGAALRAAILKMQRGELGEPWQREQWKHPRFWAPFILVGDWK